MLGSFYILTEDSKEKIEVKELHANLWFLNKKKAFLDVGLWLDFEKEFFNSKDSFNFTIYTPFSAKGKIESLYQTISKEPMMRLLHNEDISIKSFGETNSLFSVVKFKDNPERSVFLLLNPDISLINNEFNKIQMTISYSGFDELKAELDKVFQEINNQQQTNIVQPVGVYVRFRQFIDLTKSSNISVIKDFYYEKIRIDLRLNDERSVPIGNLRKKSISIGKFMFFVILPNTYEVLTDVSQARKYARILEPKWQEYIGDAPLNFWRKIWKVRSSRNLDSYIEKLLVYYWRSSGVGNNSFNLLITCQKNRRTLRIWLFTLLVLNIVSLSFYNYDKISYDWILKIWVFLLNHYWAIITIFLTISGFITAWRNWDFIKEKIGIQSD